MRKPLWTHGVASKVLRLRFNKAQKTTPWDTNGKVYLHHSLLEDISH